MQEVFFKKRNYFLCCSKSFADNNLQRKIFVFFGGFGVFFWRKTH